MVAYNWDNENCPLYGVAACPLFRVYLSAEVNKGQSGLSELLSATHNAVAGFLILIPFIIMNTTLFIGTSSECQVCHLNVTKDWCTCVCLAR